MNNINLLLRPPYNQTYFFRMHTNALKKFFSVLDAAHQAVDKLTEKMGVTNSQKIVFFRMRLVVENNVAKILE